MISCVVLKRLQINCKFGGARACMISIRLKKMWSIGFVTLLSKMFGMFLVCTLIWFSVDVDGKVSVLS